MGYHIAICDDEAVEIEYLKALVNDWADAGGSALRISAFESAEAFLFAYAGNKSFDILLLDIQMKDMDGIELAREIRQANETMQIIFITGFPDYMPEGYEVSALHYLMKPVGREKLFEVLDRATAKMRAAPRTVLLPAGDGYMRMPCDDIFYAEAFSHSVTLYTREGKKDFNMRISDMEKLLGKGFFRCHRSYVVAMRHVRRVTRTAILLDTGKEIPLSRKLYDEANQAFIRSC